MKASEEHAAFFFRNIQTAYESSRFLHTSVISYESIRCKNLEGHNLYPKITCFVGLAEKSW